MPCVEPLGRQRGVAVEIAERGLEAGVLEHPPDHAGIHPADGVDAGARHLPTLEGDGELAGGVVEGGIDAVAREDLAGEGVEVGLGDLEVVAAEDLAGVGRLHRPPDPAVAEAVAELSAQDRDRLVEAPRRQLELLHRVAPDPLPVALLEPPPHPPGDRAEGPVMLVERPMNGAGAARGEAGQVPGRSMHRMVSRFRGRPAHAF